MVTMVVALFQTRECTVASSFGIDLCLNRGALSLNANAALALGKRSSPVLHGVPVACSRQACSESKSSSGLSSIDTI